MFFLIIFLTEFCSEFAPLLHRNSTRNFFLHCDETRKTWKSLVLHANNILFWHVALCNNSPYSKRAVEKRIENHFEKASRNHGKSIENSLRFLHALLIRFCMDSDLIFKSFSIKNGKSTPRRVSGIHCFLN